MTDKLWRIFRKLLSRPMQNSDAFSEKMYQWGAYIVQDAENAIISLRSIRNARPQ